MWDIFHARGVLLEFASGGDRSINRMWATCSAANGHSMDRLSVWMASVARFFFRPGRRWQALKGGSFFLCPQWHWWAGMGGRRVRVGFSEKGARCDAFVGGENTTFLFFFFDAPPAPFCFSSVGLRWTPSPPAGRPADLLSFRLN